jgi:hypothetical protein
MVDTALVVLQNSTDLEKLQGPQSEICPASSHDAYQAISIKVEKLSDLEDEDDLTPTAFPGIKAEREVSCNSVSVLAGFHRYGYPSFYKLLLQ